MLEEVCIRVENRVLNILAVQKRNNSREKLKLPGGRTSLFTGVDIMLTGALHCDLQVGNLVVDGAFEILRGSVKESSDAVKELPSHLFILSPPLRLGLLQRGVQSPLDGPLPPLLGRQMILILWLGRGLGSSLTSVGGSAPRFSRGSLAIAEVTICALLVIPLSFLLAPSFLRPFGFAFCTLPPRRLQRLSYIVIDGDRSVFNICGRGIVVFELVLVDF